MPHSLSEAVLTIRSARSKNLNMKAVSIKNLVRLIFCAGLFFISTVNQINAQERVVALVGGTIIDGTGRLPLTGYTILIRVSAEIRRNR